MNWIFFGTRPQKEIATRDMMRNLGFTATVPMITERGRRRRGHRVIDQTERVLLPGNVFIGFEGAAIPWNDLQPYHPWPLGRLRMNGDHPAMLGNADMLRLDEFLIDNSVAPEIFATGEKVRLFTQGFEGCDFDVVDVRSKDLVVEANILGAPRKMTVPKAHVSKVS